MVRARLRRSDPTTNSSSAAYHAVLTGTPELIVSRGDHVLIISVPAGPCIPSRPQRHHDRDHVHPGADSTSRSTYVPPSHTMATSADHLRPMPLPSTSRAPAPLPTGRAKSGTNGGTRFVIPRDSYSKFTDGSASGDITLTLHAHVADVPPLADNAPHAFPRANAVFHHFTSEVGYSSINNTNIRSYACLTKKWG